jgi:hypothetical protein
MKAMRVRDTTVTPAGRARPLLLKIRFCVFNKKTSAGWAEASWAPTLSIYGDVSKGWDCTERKS